VNHLKLENIREKLIFNDEEIDSLFNILSTVNLNDSEKKIIEKSINLLINHPSFNTKRKRILNVIFNKGITVSLTFSNQIASQANYALFHYDKWSQYNDFQKLICLLEEFVHHFWDTDDEIFVSSIVCEILPGITFDPNNGNYIPLNS
jgi:hypothetical protein